MDPSEPSRYLIPEWLERVIEDCKEEARYCYSIWPLKLLDKTTRRLVWNLCSKLSVQTKGVPGQACRLVEMYLAAHFYMQSLNYTTKEEWDGFRLLLVSRVPLVIASAIQLTAKMSSMGDRVGVSAIKRVLLTKGINYRTEDILSSEFEVLKTLKFRIPMWTSVEAAELFAVELNMPPVMVRGVGIIVDIIEFHRYELEADIIKTTSTYKEALGKSKLRTMHMCAAAVLATARYLRYNGPDIAERLATLSRTPVTYLNCVSNLMLQYIEQDNEPLAIKRRKMIH
ncbi:uncharacterized protein LOC115444863 isoform X1 [Manduca sexta]|uniref:uncharacterized protein LOC115444863 isoform X1 n=1 Tax=Manduca sexta TaxID=7130 RepID=UPI00118205A5|nr:uncharacterized protein LOC115444863 isoform X1 [Manduca sexta]